MSRRESRDGPNSRLNFAHAYSTSSKWRPPKWLPNNNNCKFRKSYRNTLGTRPPIRNLNYEILIHITNPKIIECRANIGMDSFDIGAGRRDEDLAARTGQMANQFSRQWSIFKDKITPFVVPRWIFSSVTLLLFMMRVILSAGCPRIDPDFQASQDEMDLDSGPSLPTKVNDEFRPFVRRLPEFKFWYMGTKATLISLFLSMFDMFDLPVFWPILLLYFFVLTFLTLRRQIQHMYKHGYVPWTTGKTRYGQG